MKIIRAGNLNKLNKVKRFTCEKCGCIFEATKDEYNIGSQYNQTYYFAICPFCKEKAYINEN